MRVLTDADVIPRFVLEDHPELAPRAVALFERAAVGAVQLVIPPTVPAECFSTLESFYKLPRAEVASGLLKVLNLPGAVVPEEQAVTEALRRLKERRVDFADAYLAALGRTLALPVASFDGDLRTLGADVLDA